MRRETPLTWLAHAVVGLYLGVPVLATFLFSLATRWDATVLPEGYTLAWYARMLADREVHAAMARSLLVAAATLVLCLLTIVPAAFVSYIYYPALLQYLRVLALVPYALPPVILGVGLIRIYSGGPLPIAGTVWILLFSYVVICLPYVYTAVVNSLRAIDARTLMEAALSVGASRMRAFLQVILPNVRAGIISAALLAFSVTLGEFVLANLLVGGRYPTLMIVLERAMHQDGRLSSAMVVLYFAVVGVASLLMVRIMNRAAGGRALAAGRGASLQEYRGAAG